MKTTLFGFSKALAVTGICLAASACASKPAAFQQGAVVPTYPYGYQANAQPVQQMYYAPAASVSTTRVVPASTTPTYSTQYVDAPFLIRKD